MRLKTRLILTAALLGATSIVVGTVYDMFFPAKPSQEHTMSYHDFKAQNQDFANAAKTFTEAQ